MGSLAESEIVGLSAVELAEAVRGSVLDPVQVVAAHVERIQAVDPAVRAFVEVFERELPNAAQLVAAPGGEDSLLAVAGTIEAHQPWVRHAPLPPGGRVSPD